MAYKLPLGIEIPSLTSDINNRCCTGGPFTKPIEEFLPLLNDADTRSKGRFKITRMVFYYVDRLMEQFPELSYEISYAALAEQICQEVFQQSENANA